MKKWGNAWRDYKPPVVTGGTAEPAAKKVGRVKGAKRCVLTPDDQILDASTKADGITFMSKREATCFIKLRQIERAGGIINLQRQVRVPLYAITPHGEKEKVCVWVADYVFTDATSGATIYADAKGWRTDVYKIKARWFKAQFGFPILEM